MGFDLKIQGNWGQQFQTSSTKKLPFGTVMELPDGREFVYARAGAVALDVGKVMQQAVVISGHTKDLVPAATVIGANTVTLTNSTTAITADMYAEGTLFVNAGAGLGYSYHIKSHPAEATGSATCLFTLEEDDALQVALVAATSKCGLRKHTCDGVLVAPTTFTGVVVGVTVCAVTENYYCWLLKKGATAALTNGTVIVGKAVNRSETTAGAVDVYPLNSSATSGQQPMIGFVESVGATAEYSLVDFNIK